MKTVKITSIDRLIKSIQQVDRFLIPAMELEVQNTRDRLNRGIEVDGDQFAPYKNPNRPEFRGRRPLQFAARLFNEAQIDVSETSFGGVELRATIVGTPATIAIWQNVMRDFLGYSTQDRREMVGKTMAALRESYKRVPQS